MNLDFRVLSQLSANICIYSMSLMERKCRTENRFTMCTGMVEQLYAIVEVD